MRVLQKCFSREDVPQMLVTDNGSQFCAAELKTLLDSIGCRHLRTAPRYPCSNGIAENLVKMLKSAIFSANPRTILELEILLDNFLLQYRNAAHTTTKESPAKLFKARSLRSSLRCVDLIDDVYLRGNDLRPSRGIITRKIGQATVEITDMTDATVHRCHIDQIHFNETSTSKEAPVEEIQGYPNGETPSTTTEDRRQQPSIPEMSADENIPLALRRPIRRASQIDDLGPVIHIAWLALRIPCVILLLLHLIVYG
ncbi:unnamed protein product [Echinostoma caproni]|uniref:Integrase catalytic domain-containing protein n=1 Tax=Echinostoma caproni TaxID=27848 RepID=A0A183AYI0_9TREM|nr:unnamed protein product [Echinostoma caproni]